MLGVLSYRFRHESLSIILHCVQILLSVLESYRFCPLIGPFLRKLEKSSMSLANWVPTQFSHASAFSALGRSRKHACGSAKGTYCAQAHLLRHKSLSIFVRFTPNLLSARGPTSLASGIAAVRQAVRKSRRAFTNANKNTSIRRCFYLRYRLPPIRRPGFRRSTMKTFEYFFGERVF